MQLGLQDLDYKQIKEGLKTIELRAPSSNKSYDQLREGDELTFVNENSGEQLITRIIRIKHYSTVDALLEQISFEKINPHLSSKKMVIDKLFSIPTYEQRIKKDGVYAIEFRLDCE
jgi:ASC-1-like (ASCH) protein